MEMIRTRMWWIEREEQRPILLCILLFTLQRFPPHYHLRVFACTSAYAPHNLLL